MLFLVFTDKRITRQDQEIKCLLYSNRIQDKSIVSSIQPKSDDQFFVDLYFCTSYKRQIVSILICKTGRTISGSQLVQNT